LQQDRKRSSGSQHRRLDELQQYDQPPNAEILTSKATRAAIKRSGSILLESSCRRFAETVLSAKI
jgi:hypothetical protein